MHMVSIYNVVVNQWMGFLGGNVIIRVAKKALKEFGVVHQIIAFDSKLEEEISELKHEIWECFSQRKGHSIHKIESELADVIMLLIQVVIHFKLSPWRIYHALRYKAKRTDERINSGYYDKPVQAHHKTKECDRHSCTTCVDGAKYESSHPCNICQVDEICFWREKE